MLFRSREGREKDGDREHFKTERERRELSDGLKKQVMNERDEWRVRQQGVGAECWNR